MTASSLGKQLSELGFHFAADNLDDVVARATKQRWGAVELLGYLATEESSARARRGVERRLSSSKLGRMSPMANFDWGWPTRIDRAAVESALKLEFLEGARNVVLIAPQGLGKTMIAQNLAHEAILKGHSALFTTASSMLLDLGAQESARTLDTRLKHYARPAVLVVDEVGYLSYDSRNADLLFQVVSRRYENKSLVLTTNLHFGDWANVFPNAACATALIDRIVHHADVISIEGKSFRRREAEAAKAKRAKA